MVKQSIISETKIETPDHQSSIPYSTADKTNANADNGSTVILTVGKTLAIRLDTHSGGGYQYSLDNYDITILNLNKNETIESDLTNQNPPIIGGGNLEQWTFTALKPGSTKVELTNFRSFEPRPTRPTFTLTVVVQQSND